MVGVEITTKISSLPDLENLRSCVRYIKTQQPQIYCLRDRNNGRATGIVKAKGARESALWVAC
jgi:hypothetical protein